MAEVSAEQVLAEARKHIGYLEGRDANGNWNNINKFGAAYGANGVAWCSIFVWYCFNVLGSKLYPKTAWTPNVLAHGRKLGQTGHYPPRPGDVMLFNRPDGTTYHVGIVEKYLGNGRVQTIEGNTNNSGSPQGNGVYRLTRTDSPTNKGVVYWRPSYGTGTPAPTAPATNPKITAAKAAVATALSAVQTADKAIDSIPDGTSLSAVRANSDAAVKAVTLVRDSLAKFK